MIPGSTAHLGSRVSPKTTLNAKFAKRPMSFKNSSLKLKRRSSQKLVFAMEMFILVKFDVLFDIQHIISSIDNDIFIKNAYS